MSNEVNNNSLVLWELGNHLETKALKDKNNKDLSNILTKFKFTLENNPKPEEIVLIRNFINNLKILNAKYEKSEYEEAKNPTPNFENLSDEFELYLGINKLLGNARKEVKPVLSINKAGLPDWAKINKSNWNIYLEMTPSLWITKVLLNNNPFDNNWLFEYKLWDLIINAQNLKKPMPWEVDTYSITLESVEWDLINTTLTVEGWPSVIKITSVNTQKNK